MAVRELVTKVTFKVDSSSLGRTNDAIKSLKRNLENLGGSLDSSMSNSLNNVRRNITRVSLSIRNLQRQMQNLNSSSGGRGGTNGGTSGGSLSFGNGNFKIGTANIRSGNVRLTSGSTKVSGGTVTVTGFRPPTDGHSSSSGNLNALRNIRVMHADRVFVKGNVDQRGSGGSGSGGSGGGNGGDPDGGGSPHGDNGGSPHNPSGGRLRNFVDHSGEMLAAGAALTAPIIFPVREAMEFESAMADVKKVVDFDGAEDFNAMGKAIQEMSMKIPMAQEDLAAIVASGGQAGIEKENLLDFAESAAKMGVAFDIPADKAGDMMAQWRTAFGMGQSEVVDLADKVNYLGNTTAASAPKISEVVSRIGPLGEVAGLSSGEIAALGASVVATGTAPEVAATSIKNLMNALGRGENATKGQAEALQKLGFNSVELAKRLKSEGAPVVVEFLKSLDKLEGYEVNAVLGAIVGEEGKAPIAALTGDKISMLEKNLNAVSTDNKSEWGGSMEGEFAARAATTENSLQLLENSFSVLMANVGVALLPVLQSIAETLMPVIQNVLEFVQNNQELVGTVLAVVAALGVLLTILGTVGLLIGGLMGLAPVFSAIGGVIAGAFGAITALSAPVLAAIFAIGAAIYYVYEHWDELKAYFASSMPEIEAAVGKFKSAWENLQPAIEAIKPVLAAIADFVGGVLVGAIKLLWDIGVAAFGAVASAAETAAGIISGIVGVIQDVIGWLGSLISKSDEAASKSANNASSVKNYSTNYYNSYTQTNNVSGYPPGAAANFVNGVGTSASNTN